MGSLGLGSLGLGSLELGSLGLGSLGLGSLGLRSLGLGSFGELHQIAIRGTMLGPSGELKNDGGEPLGPRNLMAFFRDSKNPIQASLVGE